jgi:hypothetical protein
LGISCEKSRFYDKKIVFFPIAEGGAKIFGVFRVKNHDFTLKNLIFSNFRGGARAGCAPPPPPTHGSAPAGYTRRRKTKQKHNTLCVGYYLSVYISYNQNERTVCSHMGIRLYQFIYLHYTELRVVLNI